jgi:hypothetical protein
MLHVGIDRLRLTPHVYWDVIACIIMWWPMRKAIQVGRLSAVAATSMYSLLSLDLALHRRSPTFHELTYKSFTRSPPPTTKVRTFVAQLVPRDTPFHGIHPEILGLHLLLCDQGLGIPPLST